MTGKNIDFGFVADIYDNYVNTDFDISFYKELCKDYESILELMCGTGRISIPLIQAGVDLTCVDYSQEMLNILGSKLNDGNASMLCQDVCKLDVGKSFDLVFIAFNSIAEIIDRMRRKLAFRCIYDHVNTGGSFFCTLYNPAYRIKSADGNLKCLGKYDIGENKTLLITHFNSYDSERNLIYGTQFYEIYDRRNRLMDKRFLDIAFSLITREELLEDCGEAGFKIQSIYGDYDFGPYTEESRFMNFLFRK